MATYSIVYLWNELLRRSYRQIHDRQKYGISGKHSRNARNQHFDLLKAAYITLRESFRGFGQALSIPVTKSYSYYTMIDTLLLTSWALCFCWWLRHWVTTPAWYTMMTSSNGNIFRVTGPLCGEFTGHRWIPRTKVSGVGLWCFLLPAPEKTVE